MPTTPYTAFRSPPDKTTVAPAMVAPASVPGGGTLHLDALGNALQVGDTVQFSDWMPVEVITALLPGGRFAHGDKTNFCCVVVRVASAPALTSSDDVLFWPCNTWCYRHQLAEFSHLSDDFQVIKAGTHAWLAFENDSDFFRVCGAA
jgi:hypothetical protein